MIAPIKHAALLIGMVLVFSSARAATPAQTPASASNQSANAYDLGMKLLREKRYPEALEQFKGLERRAPQLPQGYTGEGIALALMGRPEESIQALRKALEIDPKFWVAQRELGIVCWQANQKDAAAKELREIVKLFPDDPAVNVLLAQYDFEHADYAQASGHFAKAHIQVAADARLSLMAAEAQLRSGATTQAREALQALVPSPSLNPQQRFRLGWLLGEAGDYAGSIHVLRSLPADYPDAFGREYGIALAYYQDGKFADCIKTLGDLQERKVLRPEIFNLLGAAEERNRNTLEAYNAFRTGILAFPKDDQNYLRIATLSAQHFNYALGVEILTTGIGLMPDDYKLYLTRGVVQTLARQLQLARTDFEKSVAMAPDQPDGYLGLGLCDMDEDRVEDALAAFQEGVRRAPQEVALHYFVGDALLRKGIAPGTPEYAEALTAADTTLRLEPEFAHGYFQRGRLELLNHEVEKALADLEHARSLAPDARDITYQLAVAYRTAGRKADAEKLLSSVREASEKDAAEFRTGQLRDMIITLSGSTPGAQ